jgi:multidrug resistance efflux pump
VVTGSSQTVLAPVDGRLSRVFMAPGALVSRGAPLFEITGAAPDPTVRRDAGTRLAADRARAERLTQRIQELDSLLTASRSGPATPSALRDADQMRQRQNDLQDEQRDNDAEIAQLERSIAATADPGPVRTVLAEQDAVIRRVPVAAGQDVVPGLPLAELVGCDHLSVTADGAAAAALGLVSGRALHIRLEGGQSVIAAQVPGYALRNGSSANADRSAGLAPPGQLSVPVDRAAVERAARESCPIGRRALIEAD